MILLGKFKNKDGVAIPNLNPKVTWAVFLAFVAIGFASQSTDSVAARSNGTSDSTASSSSGWGSSQEKRMVGVYQCADPMWAIQLKHGGDYIMEALDSGSRFSGTWSADGNSGVLQGTYPSKAAMSITIANDGAITVDKYGYVFVRTN